MDKTTTSTNSPIGSHHWYNTLVCRIRRIGEYMYAKPDSDTHTQEWGKVIYDSCNELLTGRDHINSSSPPQQAVSDEEIEQYAQDETDGEGGTHAYHAAFRDGKHDGIIQGAKWMRDRTAPSEAETILRELLWFHDAWVEPTQPSFSDDLNRKYSEIISRTRKWCAANPVKADNANNDE